MESRSTGRESSDASSELIPISALQHWSYCQRQCGLIHLEQTFDENLYTLRGRHAHERVDDPGEETRRGVHVERSLTLWSHRLGLIGRADVVEFIEGRPYPVEYKVGARKSGGHDELQLCAQAMCLEEMMEVAVPNGALYYYAVRRRYEIDFDPQLRARVVAAIVGIRGLFESGHLPPAPNDARCPKCSLIDSCLPAVVVRGGVSRLYEEQLFEVGDDGVAGG
jgi:CRISPR-associated exonuclease Cas4